MDNENDEIFSPCLDVNIKDKPKAMKGRFECKNITSRMQCLHNDDKIENCETSL